MSSFLHAAKLRFGLCFDLLRRFNTSSIPGLEFILILGQTDKNGSQESVALCRA